MIEMTIDKLRVRPSVQPKVIVLMAKGQNRCLPIWIGPIEADAIALGLRGQETPRPLTHDLMDSLIGDLGAQVERVVIKNMKDDTFLANVMLQSDAAIIERDARPSDAIALAVRNNAPIFAEQSVLDRVGVPVDPRTNRPEHTAFDLSSLSLEDLEQLLSEEVKDVLERAAVRSKARGYDTFEPQDVMLALLQKPECTATRVMEDLGMHLQTTREKLEDYGSTRAHSTDVRLQPEEWVRIMLRSAKSEAANLFDVLIETEHLLLAFLQSDSGAIAQISSDYDIGIERARTAVYKALSEWEVSTRELA